jgi:hypothetical protein
MRARPVDGLAIRRQARVLMITMMAMCVNLSGYQSSERKG